MTKHEVDRTGFFTPKIESLFQIVLECLSWLAPSFILGCNLQCFGSNWFNFDCSACTLPIILLRELSRQWLCWVSVISSCKAIKMKNHLIGQSRYLSNHTCFFLPLCLLLQPVYTLVCFCSLLQPLLAASQMKAQPCPLVGTRGHARSRS